LRKKILLLYEGMNLEVKAKTDLGSFVCENVDEIVVKIGPRNVHNFGYLGGYGKW